MALLSPANVAAIDEDVAALGKGRTPAGQGIPVGEQIGSADDLVAQVQLACRTMGKNINISDFVLAKRRDRVAELSEKIPTGIKGDQG